ncbi:DUF1905 domain-containing protein [Lacisediminihabitans sp. FW035]
MEQIALPQALDYEFEATLVGDMGPHRWTVVKVPGSADFFGTRKSLKVAGTMDGCAFAATMLALGEGVHMIPVTAALRKAIGKDAGADVTVRLLSRLS